MAMDIFTLLEKGVVMVIDIFTFSLEKGRGLRRSERRARSTTWKHD